MSQDNFTSIDRGKGRIEQNMPKNYWLIQNDFLCAAVAEKGMEVHEIWVPALPAFTL